MKILLTLIVLQFAMLSYAQEAAVDSFLTPSMALTSKHYGDQITLRWAPTDAETWFYGMQYGYQLSRRTIADTFTNYEVIVDTIRPWSEKEMADYIITHPDDQEVMLPYKAVYKDWEDTYYKESGWAEAIEKSMFFQQRYQMSILTADLYPIVGDAAGLRYIDKNIENEQRYAYRITLNYPKPDAFATDVVRRTPILEKPVIFDAVEKENSIAITWERRLHEKYYTAYHIERSIDGVNYERLLDRPYIHALGQEFENQKFINYTDKVENYQPYHYRIIGIDAFGDLSEPSEFIIAKGKDRTPPKVGMLQGRVSEEGNSNILSWSHDPISEIKQAVIYKNDPVNKGTLVYNSLEEGNFQQEIVDPDLVEGMSDYYLILVDTAGNYATSPKTSLYQKDKTPPRPPVGLTSAVDTNGTVTLTWDAPEDNDVIGYYLYSSDRSVNNYIKLNQFKHQFRQYVDTINTALLTEKRFYKVAAIDKGGNIGEYSVVLEVNLPDKIPPAPCLFYDYKVDSLGIYLGLLTSSSRDVVKYELSRMRKSETEWKLIKSFDQNPPKLYLDKTVASAEDYIYKWIAIDEAGLHSSADRSMIQLRAMDTRIYYRPKLRLTVNEDVVNIDVAQDIPGENYRIQILRAIGDGKFRTLKTLQSLVQVQDHVKGDKDKPLNSRYVARILYEDGVKSKYGQEVSL